jgi:subtilisin family serine protease
MLAGLTGRGIRIAIVDSGVHAAHPHVGGVAGGAGIDVHGLEHGDFVDRLGHGTAVAAAIHEKAPDAAIFVVKVFDRALSTSITSLVAAIDLAARSGTHLINLSLGTSQELHEAALRDAVARAARCGARIVSARDEGSDPPVRWFPGALPGVVAVQVDWQLPRDAYEVAAIGDGLVFRASGFAREIPGVPPDRNLHGVSFAVANMTGFAARALEAIAPERSLHALLASLQGRARSPAPSP